MSAPAIAPIAVERPHLEDCKLCRGEQSSLVRRVVRFRVCESCAESIDRAGQETSTEDEPSITARDLDEILRLRVELAIRIAQLSAARWNWNEQRKRLELQSGAWVLSTYFSLLLVVVLLVWIGRH